MMCAHPHGVLAFNRALFGFSTRTLWDRAFPGVKFRVLTATAAFRVPVIREMWLWSYCIDASKTTCRGAMDAGLSILLYPGGGEGADFDHQREAQIVFEQAKGRVTVRVGVRATIRVRLNLGLQLGLQVERLDLTKFG